MLRVVARHVVLSALQEPERISLWLKEIALTEGVEGWVALSADGIEAWFEGSTSAVDTMVAWCESRGAELGGAIQSTSQRPCLKGGFEILKQAPSS
ncbi:MAG: acylphosphatase [Myxococcota bacterium]